MNNSSILIGEIAPDFTAPAVLYNGEMVETFNLYEEIKNNHAILFFYPLDFTFVCPTELIALNNRISKFKQLNTKVISISIDSHHTHNVYRNTKPSKGGIGPINFTMVSDNTHKICRSYGVEHKTLGVAFRASFVIDTNKIIRHQSINDLAIGRNIDELIRIINAIHFSKETNQVCPSGWQIGMSGITPSSDGITEYLDKYSDVL